jgi:two-component system sensor histidine kinase YesM
MLRIRIKKEDDKVCIMIFDNGTGIRKEELNELNKRLKETGEHPLEYIEQYKSLGILNVHLRSKLYYGEGYSIEIFSKEGKGTCIVIKIPFLCDQPEEGKENNVQSDDC